MPIVLGVIPECHLSEIRIEDVSHIGGEWRGRHAKSHIL